MRKVSLLSIVFRIFIAVLCTGFAFTTGNFYRMGRGDHLLYLTIFWALMAVMSILLATLMITTRRSQVFRPRRHATNPDKVAVVTSKPYHHDFDDIDPHDDRLDPDPDD